MGTNYYTKINECKCCGRYEEIHIGKSSCGWKFCFNLNDKKYYKNYTELIDWLKDKIIEDEYGDVILIEEFLEIIKEKQNSKLDDGYVIKIGGYHFVDGEFS